jgi:hypothetical protein
MLRHPYHRRVQDLGGAHGSFGSGASDRATERSSGRTAEAHASTNPDKQQEARPQVVTPAEFCRTVRGSGGRYGSQHGGAQEREYSEREAKGMRGRVLKGQTFSPTPRIRRPRRSEEVKAGAPNPYGARSSGETL